ncbi:MAG: hypothetical protein KDA22_02835 [Phycisphaerales bacterium]|nr:hypothetical protein [Phycisphaerales bacterium]
MRVSCPNCDTALGAPDWNVATDVAACPKCNEVFALSSIVSAGGGLDDFDIHQPPKGATFDEHGTGWRITASTRSPAAFFLVPFMCVWSGFSLGGIYGSQIASGQFSLGMSLFGIPFVLGTLLFGSIAVMSVCGRIVVSIDHSDGRVFAGVGPIGWTRRFDWRSITSVEENSSGYHASGSTGLVIALVGQSRLKFGSMLSDPRRFYVLQGLRVLLAARGT